MGGRLVIDLVFSLQPANNSFHSASTDGIVIQMKMDFADGWVLVKKSAQGHRHNILSFSLKHTG